MNARASISALRKKAPSSAVELYAKPSPDYAGKLAHARLLLREAAELGEVTQAHGPVHQRLGVAAQLGIDSCQIQVEGACGGELAHACTSAK